jgi:predicted ATPase
LDDLQWIDSASLKVLEILINDIEESRLFIIGAYREDEIHKNCNLANLIKNINDKNINLTCIKLKALGVREKIA